MRNRVPCACTKLTCVPFFRSRAFVQDYEGDPWRRMSSSIEKKHFRLIFDFNLSISQKVKLKQVDDFGLFCRFFGRTLFGYEWNFRISENPRLSENNRTNSFPNSGIFGVHSYPDSAEKLKNRPKSSTCLSFLDSGNFGYSHPTPISENPRIRKTGDIRWVFDIPRNF